MLQLVNAYKFSAQLEQSPFFHQKKKKESDCPRGENI